MKNISQSFSLKQGFFTFLYKSYWLLLAGILLVLGCNFWIVWKTDAFNFLEIEKLPSFKTGLVLGTSKKLSNNSENFFFTYRIKTAAQLYKAGKVERLILSGNNDSKYYNEPLEMSLALQKEGIPEEVLIKDFSGYRTYDSVLRCQKIFKEDSIIIVSQSFHNARALFIAQEIGLYAVGIGAQDVPLQHSFQVLLREYFARPKAILDAYFFKPPIDEGNFQINKIRK